LSLSQHGLAATVATISHEAQFPRDNLVAQSDFAPPGRQTEEVQVPGVRVPNTVTASALAGLAANQYRSSQPPISTGLSEASRQWLLSHSVEAEDVPSVLTTDQAEETALQVAPSESYNPASANALEGLTAMFFQEPDPERKQDILAAAQYLGSNTAVNILPMIQAAMQPAQPANVQRQGLYMATDLAPEVVQAVAADPLSQFQQDAQAFLLKAQSP
jgi:hypothetical protein